MRTARSPEIESVARRELIAFETGDMAAMANLVSLAFGSARAAVRAAVEIQRASDHGSFGVRIGVHTGEVIRTADDLLGLTVNKAARVAAAADSGSIMISSTTRDPMIVALKGFSDTHQVVPIEWE